MPLTRAQSLFFGLVLGLGGGLAWWPLVPVTLVISVALVLVVPRQRADRRRAAVAESLPAVIDLILVALSAGATIGGALQVVVARGPSVVRPGVAAALARHRTGEPLAVVLRALPDLLHPDYRALSLTLAQAEREGAALGSLLQRLSDEAQQARRRRLEAAARRAPVQMILPLVLCALPAVVIGAVVPLVMVSLRRI